ncbi:MAG TPA: type I methionyl aminopeptidase [Chloroflexia bacterium]|nr:type I methionyl aminopeptidase [Chloroflexia bacterium]
MAIYTKTPQQIELIRQAGRIVGQALQLVKEQVKPGVTTQELDDIAYNFIKKQGAIPTFKGYHPFPSIPAFPGTLCTSVNEQIVHGIPTERVLEEGDIISIDCGAIYRGWHGDSAMTVPVGKVSPEIEKLLETGRESLMLGIAQARAGNRIGDISSTIEKRIKQGNPGYGIVREYGGHGIGKSLWEEPSVPNYGAAGRGVKLAEGMVIAIEPMINLGTHETETMPDFWTVVTRDRKPSCHFEHTVAVTSNGPDILTLP